MTATTVAVLSGKGGTAKTLWQLLMAGEASREGMKTLLIDTDPERNLSNKLAAPADAGGMAVVLQAAGAVTGETNAADGAARVDAEIMPITWSGVELLPAGSGLLGIGQLSIEDTWLLRDILDGAKIYDRYDLVLIDTAGRTGALSTLAMYAADVAYAPITPSTDAVKKAAEARARVQRIQRAHPLRWAGVVLTDFDVRTGVEIAIRDIAYEEFGEYIRAEVPRRVAIKEAFTFADRLGDRRDAETLAEIFRGFLLRDLMQQKVDTIPTGVLQ